MAVCPLSMVARYLYQCAHAPQTPIWVTQGPYVGYFVYNIVLVSSAMARHCMVYSSYSLVAMY